MQFFFSCIIPPSSFFFFFNDTATTEIYTLSLHDALPISAVAHSAYSRHKAMPRKPLHSKALHFQTRSEEHTSELQSQSNIVCRLLLEKKKQTNISNVEHRPAEVSTSRRYVFARFVVSTAH